MSNNRFWKLYQNIYGEEINHNLSRVDVLATIDLQRAKTFVEKLFKNDNQMLMHHFKTDDGKYNVFLPSSGVQYDVGNYSDYGDYRIYWYL
jgi:hypothetical protein